MSYGSSSPLLATAAISCPLPTGVTRWCFVGSRLSGAWSTVAGGVATLLLVRQASDYTVSVGCAGGCDLAVRATFFRLPCLTVFEAASRSRGALAARSAACVRSVLPAAGGCVLAFPSGPCPAGVAVRRSFRGCGSGSWGSVGLALGLGLPVLVYVPPGVAVVGFAGPLASQLPVVASGAWGAWLGAAAVPPPLSLFE